MADENVKLVLDVDATSVKAARADVYDFAQTIVHVSGESYELAEVTRVSTAAIDKEAMAWTAAAKAAQYSASATKQATKEAEAHAVAAHKSAGGSASAGQAMMQWSRSLQDFQAAGLMGILNNIELMTTSIGGSAGLAGILTVAAAGLYALTPAIRSALEPFREFFKTVDLGKDVLETLNERVEELKNKKVKLAVDVLELENAENKVKEITKGLQAYEEWKNLHTDWEKKSGSAVTDVLANDSQGAASTEAKVRANVLKDLGGSSGARRDAKENFDKIDALIKDLQANPWKQVGPAYSLPALMKSREQAREVLSAQDTKHSEADAITGNLFGDAKTGKGEGNKRLADALRKAGRGDLADKIEGASAGNIKANAQEESELEAESRSNYAFYQDKLKDKAKAKVAADKAEHERKQRGAEEVDAAEASPEIKEIGRNLADTRHMPRDGETHAQMEHRLQKQRDKEIHDASAADYHRYINSAAGQRALEHEKSGKAARKSVEDQGLNVLAERYRAQTGDHATSDVVVKQQLKEMLRAQASSDREALMYLAEVAGMASQFASQQKAMEQNFKAARTQIRKTRVQGETRGDN